MAGAVPIQGVSYQEIQSRRIITRNYSAYKCVQIVENGLKTIDINKDGYIDRKEATTAFGSDQKKIDGFFDRLIRFRQVFLIYSASKNAILTAMKSPLRAQVFFNVARSHLLQSSTTVFPKPKLSLSSAAGAVGLGVTFFSAFVFGITEGKLGAASAYNAPVKSLTVQFARGDAASFAILSLTFYNNVTKTKVIKLRGHYPPPTRWRWRRYRPTI